MTCCTSFRRVVSGEARGLGPTLARGALRVLSVPYGLGVSFRDMARAGDEVDVGLPVISVGNLTAGGTGKTPLVALVLAELKKRGRRPVVLSRGYGAADGGPNDEAKVLAAAHPDVLHLQGADRLALARRAADEHLGDVLVLDDGFQQIGIAKRLNVCAIDATNPFGYGAVLPRGLLRERPSALYRARPVVVTRAELAPAGRVEAIRREVLRWNEFARIVVSEMRFSALTDAAGASAGAPADLAGKRVLLACGVGNPEAFASGVRALGARVDGHLEFPDHHAYATADVASIAKRAAELACEVVVTTAKDAVKLATLPWAGDVPLRVLHVEAVITGEKELWTKLLDEALASA
jgi:tetraacyldisaccharide 4'-kinase